MGTWGVSSAFFHSATGTLVATAIIVQDILMYLVISMILFMIRRKMEHN